ncbi:MAG: gamma-glutamyltransferase family protein [Sphingomicrobium sp.]
MRRFLSSLAALTLLSGCATSRPLATLAPPPIAAATVRAGTPGVVAAPNRIAAEIGASMLRRGGSAVDAAIATTVALTLLEPESTGIGGGGFLVHLDARGALTSLDGRETAPAAARPDWFVRDGKAMDFQAAVLGGRSVGVPGLLRLAEQAHRAHGKLPWASLFAPTIALANNGFAISERLASSLPLFRDAALFDDGRALYFDRTGQPLPAGTIIRDPALGQLLADVATHGAGAFYSGANARAIVNEVNHSSRNPAPMSLADLASYRAVERTPLCGRYRAYRICSMGPPASGAVTLLAILGQLERFNVKALGANSPVTWHLFAESTRLAFADRARYVGDPGFVRVPVAGLLDPSYLHQRSALIAADRTMTQVDAGVPAGATVAQAVPAGVEHGTSNVAVADRFGNVASLTSTIENGFGSGLVVNGYFLNNELTDFDLAPPSSGTPAANSVEPGKRPRSAMSPVVAFGPDGRVSFAIGAGGGATIVAQVAKAIIGVVDFGLPFDQAIALPLLFAPGDVVLLEQGSGADRFAPALEALGHRTRAQPMRLKASVVYWRDGGWHGAADTRSEGAAISE